MALIIHKAPRRFLGISSFACTPYSFVRILQCLRLPCSLSIRSEAYALQQQQHSPHRLADDAQWGLRIKASSLQPAQRYSTGCDDQQHRWLRCMQTNTMWRLPRRKDKAEVGSAVYNSGCSCLEQCLASSEGINTPVKSPISPIQSHPQPTQNPKKLYKPSIFNSLS